MAKTLRGLAQVIARDGEYAEAIPLLEESVAAFSDLDDPPLLALALTDLGVVVGHEGVALCLINLGNQARIDGNPDLARARLEEGAAIARSGNWPYIVGLMAGNLGDLALSRGDSGEACLHYREALAVFTPIGEADQLAHCVRGLARHAWIEGRASGPGPFHGGVPVRRRPRGRGHGQRGRDGSRPVAPGSAEPGCCVVRIRLYTHARPRC
jgi:tetratricopeptide (TPR) repeat protein